MDAFVDAFAMKASTLDLPAMAARIKAAREACGLSRPEFSEKFGCSIRTLENNEWGKNEPSAWLFKALRSLGVNANWLLTGEGPMLLGNLVAEELNRGLPTHGPTPAINIDCLAAIIQGTLRVSGHLPAEVLAEQIANIYKGFLDKGLLTVDGKQARNDDAAA